MTEVRTRDEALASVNLAFGIWASEVEGVLRQAQGTVAGARTEIHEVLRRRENAVAIAESLLASAPEKERRRLEAQLVNARDACDTARRAAKRADDVGMSLLALGRANRTAIIQVERARAQLSTMSSAIDGYRTGGRGISGDGLIGPPAKSLETRVDGLAVHGLREVDVNAADLGENPILDDDRSSGTFGRGGLSRADYRWAVQTWSDSVGPGVAEGKTRDDFVAFDTKTNAGSLRRRADVYDMFLGDDRIRVDRRSDGSLNVVNGRHRLLIAQELGIRSLPGEVSG